MTTPPRVVFDCNVYFQALISPEGPSARCLLNAADGKIELFCSQSSIAELLDVAARPSLRAKFDILDSNVARLIEAIREAAWVLNDVPAVYVHPIDPKDSHYIDLAIATESEFVVSRDRDLLRLVDPRSPESADFARRFPALRIVDPVVLLQLLALP
jgi:putative PIN family toxin of toxin-antitoxin system